MKKIVKIVLSGHVLKKVSTSTFWCMVTTLGPRLFIHLVKGPNALKMHCQEIKTWKCDHGKMPFEMGQLHGP
jgi:hypothetical protein